MKIFFIKLYLKKCLSKKRYAHSLNVAKCAKKIAKRCLLDSKKSYIAGLVHDIAREYDFSDLIKIAQDSGHTFTKAEIEKPVLLHGVVGAILIKKRFAIFDSEIVNAVENHTLGGENICDISKVIYVADYIEPSRVFVTDSEREKIFFENKIENMYKLVYDMSSRYFSNKNGGCFEKAIVR